MIERHQIVALPLVVAAMLVSCPKAAPEIRVEKPWVRLLLDQGAGYMVIYNDGDLVDRLVGAHSETVASISLHETRQEGEIMRMRKVERLEIPGRGQVELRPKSYHLMLSGVPRGLKPGQKLRLVLEFEVSGSVTVEAEVRPI